ncbi:hypothetical protein IHC87_17425 [Photobacterium damselae subsp. damselae]|uniref:hypothetical protein n=1 Tax=Photobacterium damselae TaxID=38293 RepID=UPI001F31CF46|nr:hypothetical protein [Photobacterium damselae]UJZ96349.1 hypothetical protein IHC87_17425 [Photobacterium damselae subsp. damselae]UJZ99746.1 hypothetical protein IHC88_20065 [Photobacterium damselae subsp. damselae]UKA12682.1 hypothetical protein IHC91_17395 [Photobacterium damselae subsp. damselae]
MSDHCLDVGQHLKKRCGSWFAQISLKPASRIVKLAEIVDIKCILRESGMELRIQDPRQRHIVSYFASAELVEKSRPRVGDFLALYDDGEVGVIAKHDVGRQ